jgi:hypothetical protein
MLNIEQGVDFAHTFHWFAGNKFMAPIELIEEGYPTVITVTDHGLNTLTPQPIFISGVEGCPHLNTVDTYVARATRIDADTFSVGRSTVGQRWIAGTGEITYHAPTDITGYTAVCTIRRSWHHSTIIHSMTTENGGINLTTEDAGIELIIPDDITASFNFKNAVYDVDMIGPGGYKQRVFRGPVVLHRDI